MQTANTFTNVPLAKLNTQSTPAQTSRQPPTPVKKLTANNTSRLTTLVSFSKLQHYLTKINYDKKLTDYLVTGFKKGFQLGHTSGPYNIQATNSKTVDQYSEVVSKKLNAEIAAGRISGPFPDPPFEKFQISPLNIREKKTPGKYRLIHDLSFPYDESSINSNIPQNQKTVKYASVTTAIQTLQSLPRGCYTAKTDIADAYRIIPMHPYQYPLLGFTFEGNFYFDKSLPQGCGSSCRLFETFSSALQAIFEHEVPEARCVHMIDDFFLAATTQATCKAHLEKFLSLCDDIGVPTAPDKTTEPATNTVFLGIELDTIQQSAKLPPDKFRDYSATIHAILDHDKVQRKTLESIVGKLSFAAFVVPARPFLRRLIDLVYTVKKPYYQIRITKQVKQDLLTWLEFLNEYNGITFFRYRRSIDSTTIHLVSDACKYGFGGCYGRKWIQGHYPNDWQQCHITILELFPIYLLTVLFGHLMANSTIVYHCDNQAVTEILNKQSSKNQLVMGLVRPLVLTLIKHNIMIMSQHIPGKNNILADRISRFQVTPALLTHYNMEKRPTAVPAHLLPGRFTITCWQT